MAESRGMGANGCNPLLFLRLTASVKDVLEVVVRLWGWERGREGREGDEYQYWQSLLLQQQKETCSQTAVLKEGGREEEAPHPATRSPPPPPPLPPSHPPFLDLAIHTLHSQPLSRYPHTTLQLQLNSGVRLFPARSCSFLCCGGDQTSC